MKPIILLAIIFLFAKCNKGFYQDKKLKHNTNYCLCRTKYIKKIDLTKPYYVNGKYCIESIKDTIGKRGIGFMCVNVFDRITGTILKNCTIKISGKENTIEDLEAGYATLPFPEGRYVLSAFIVSKFSLKTDSFFINENKKTTLNIYLGSSLQQNR